MSGGVSQTIGLNSIHSSASASATLSANQLKSFWASQHENLENVTGKQLRYTTNKREDKLARLVMSKQHDEYAVNSEDDEESGFEANGAHLPEVDEKYENGSELPIDEDYSEEQDEQELYDEEHNGTNVSGSGQFMGYDEMDENNNHEHANDEDEYENDEDLVNDDDDEEVYQTNNEAERLKQLEVFIRTNSDFDLTKPSAQDLATGLSEASHYLEQNESQLKTLVKMSRKKFPDLKLTKINKSVRDVFNEFLDASTKKRGSIGKPLLSQSGGGAYQSTNANKKSLSTSPSSSVSSPSSSHSSQNKSKVTSAMKNNGSSKNSDETNVDRQSAKRSPSPQPSTSPSSSKDSVKKFKTLPTQQQQPPPTTSLFNRFNNSAIGESTNDTEEKSNKLGESRSSPRFPETASPFRGYPSLPFDPRQPLASMFGSPPGAAPNPHLVNMSSSPYFDADFMRLAAAAAAASSSTGAANPFRFPDFGAAAAANPYLNGLSNLFRSGQLPPSLPPMPPTSSPFLTPTPPPPVASPSLGNKSSPNVVTKHSPQPVKSTSQYHQQMHHSTEASHKPIQQNKFGGIGQKALIQNHSNNGDSKQQSTTNGNGGKEVANKSKLSSKFSQLSAQEMTAIKKLILGYKESAAFLTRSAEELEELLSNGYETN